MDLGDLLGCLQHAQDLYVADHEPRQGLGYPNMPNTLMAFPTDLLSVKIPPARAIDACRSLTFCRRSGPDLPARKLSRVAPCMKHCTLLEDTSSEVHFAD